MVWNLVDTNGPPYGGEIQTGMKLDTQGESQLDPNNYHRMVKPTKKHLHAVNRIFKYLRGTINRKLCLMRITRVIARVMVNAIDKKLRDRRLMRNLEKFIGGRPYGRDLRFDTLAGNPVKEILLKLNLPDHRILKDGGEVKEFQERCLIQAFKTKKQQQYEHVGPKVTSSQDGKVYKMAKRDYAWLMISRCSRSHSHIQVKIKEQAQA
ncbi:hypothetical protein Tco_0815401 [Tanacetum coccineum]